MSILKTLVREMDAGAMGGATAASGSAASGSTSDGSGATGAHNVAGVRDHIGKKKSRKLKMIRRVAPGIKEGFMSTLMKEALGVDYGKTDFDSSDVLSKIDAAQKREFMNDDTTAFGLEDDQGNLVKVFVKNDQAEDFENQLAAMLAGQQDDETDQANAKEIAEIIHELKDKFDIVDVEWPGIEGDEEEEQEVVAGAEGGAGLESGAGGAGGAEGGAGGELDLEGGEGGDDLSLGDEGLDGEEDMTAGEDDAKSALQAVIDVMKADAEAKMADAQAREAEARAKEAEYSGQAAGAKARSQEQVYDMEAAEKEEKGRNKDSEQQAKLARFQHQKAQTAEASLSMESVKDDVDDKDEKTITLTELTNLILKNLRHQG